MSQQKHLMLKVKKSVHPNFSAEASHVKSKKNRLTLMSQQKHLMLKVNNSAHPNVSAEATHFQRKKIGSP